MNIRDKALNLSIAICEKQAGEEEIQELNSLMKEHPEAREVYLTVMDMHYDLDRMALTGALANGNDRCESLLLEFDDRFEELKKKNKSFSIWWIPLAAAAVLLLFADLSSITNLFKSQSYEAIIIESDSNSWEIGTEIKIEELIKLSDKEEIKLKFNDDTIVELSGPISTSLVQNDSQGRKFLLNKDNSTSKFLSVDSGNTKVDVADTGKSLRTRFKIIESGNAFGIQFKENLTEVHVFKGLVTSKSIGQTQNDVQRIHNLQAAGFTSEGLLKTWTKPDYESFKEPKRISGVHSTNKHVHWLSNSVKSLKEGNLESNDSVFLIEEKKNVVLPNEIPVTFSDRLHKGSGGTQSAYSTHIRMLPKGTKVDSYLLHFDPATQKYLDGDIYFDRPIVAIIARTDQLNYSDKFFAKENVEYPSSDSSFRGLDDTREEESVDVLKFKKDPKTIGIRFNVETNTVDQIRILIQSK